MDEKRNISTPIQQGALLGFYSWWIGFTPWKWSERRKMEYGFDKWVYKNLENILGCS